jgi:ribosomal protein L11
MVISKEKVREIAQIKAKDLNSIDIEGPKKQYWVLQEVWGLE